MRRMRGRVGAARPRHLQMTMTVVAHGEAVGAREPVEEHAVDIGAATGMDDEADVAGFDLEIVVRGARRRGVDDEVAVLEIGDVFARLAADGDDGGRAVGGCEREQAGDRG